MLYVSCMCSLKQAAFTTSIEFDFCAWWH